MLCGCTRFCRSRPRRNCRASGGGPAGGRGMPVRALAACCARFHPNCTTSKKACPGSSIHAPVSNVHSALLGRRLRCVTWGLWLYLWCGCTVCYGNPKKETRTAASVLADTTGQHSTSHTLETSVACQQWPREQTNVKPNIQLNIQASRILGKTVV